MCDDTIVIMSSEASYTSARALVSLRSLDLVGAKKNLPLGVQRTVVLRCIVLKIAC